MSSAVLFCLCRHRVQRQRRPAAAPLGHGAGAVFPGTPPLPLLRTSLHPRTRELVKTPSDGTTPDTRMARRPKLMS